MTIFRRLAGFLPFFISLLSCHQKDSTNAKALFTLQPNTGINFVNTVTDGDSENTILFRNFYNGGGVAIGDINNDGLPDVFLTSNMGDNKLYLNKGNFQFDDITATAHIIKDDKWNTGVTFADVNGDGWLDIYVCSSGHMTTGNRKNKLYINQHDNTFKEEAAKYGLDISAYTTQVSFFDYDGDGDLDCFMINNSPISVNALDSANKRDLPDADWPVPQTMKGGGDHLFRNDNGHFTEVTRQAGIHGTLMSFGLGVSVGDLNGDGYPDIFVSNDSYERDYLYINQRNGTFKDELENYLGHTSFSSMGADLADINNDGWPEIFTTDMLPGDDYRLRTMGAFDNSNLYNSRVKAGFYHQYMKNCLQLNNQNGKFIDVADYSGVSATDWSWGALMFDMDNDGLNDIFVCNGINKDLTNLDFMDYFANDVIQKMIRTGKKENLDDLLKTIPVTPMLHKAYKNDGDLRFSDIGTAWGFIEPSFSNGAAYADLDNDGDLDLIISNINGPAFVYKNNSREQNHNHYLGLSLHGRNPNTFAIGSKINVYKDHQIFYRELIPSRGFQSSVDYKQIIGLGKLTQVDSLIITWPDRSSTTILHPGLDTVLTIRQPDHTIPEKDPVGIPLIPTLLDSLKSNFQKHVEVSNNDFAYEENLPKMLSREGPKVAIGDINGDGLEDVYIGGTTGHPGQIYLQTHPGTFILKSEPAFDQFADFEDEAVLFFDADGDGDLDLLLCPGGNAQPPMSRQMQNRLFKNDGKGNFTLDATAFPMNKDGMNTAVAIAYDFNHDGYADLFIGGRSQPRDYGRTPRSFLFVNDGKGHFTDIAASKNPDIANIGMVTAAAWADVKGDKEKELVITGEWMAPRVFSWKGDHFSEYKTNLTDLLGWWQSLCIADVNGDGKPDLILGNIGENFYLHPDAQHPVKLWVGDFDQNGITDNIMTRTIDGKDMPVFLKRELEQQLPSLKKQNLKHAEFAKRSIQELIPPTALDNAQVKTFNYPSSIIAINEGNGHFRIQKLPFMVQLSSVNTIKSVDLNGDGLPDLVLGGNEYGFLPQFGRLDGSFGDVLLNDGKAQFIWVNPKISGLQLTGQVRDIGELDDRTARYLLFLRNDDYPGLYLINTPAKK
jgi:enediyne biosynthesis protein E4